MTIVSLSPVSVPFWLREAPTQENKNVMAGNECNRSFASERAMAIRKRSGDENNLVTKRRRKELWCGCSCERPETMIWLSGSSAPAEPYIYRCRCTWCGPEEEHALRRRNVGANSSDSSVQEIKSFVSRRCNIPMCLPLPLCEDCRRGQHGPFLREKDLKATSSSRE